jgi:hypothetical protein
MRAVRILAGGLTFAANEYDGLFVVVPGNLPSTSIVMRVWY